MTTSPDPAVAILTESACWALLRSQVVGRLAVSIEGRPEILPINYVVDHNSLVFRTAPGTKLAAIAAGSDVAVEADGYDPDTGVAWSVVVKGSGKQITRLYDLLDTVELPLFPWHAGPKQDFVRVVAREISGRRFHVVDKEAWRTALSDAPHASPE